MPLPLLALTVDLSLIERLGPDAYKDEPYPAPYVAVFSSGPYVLAFVSGDHGDGVGSPVGRTIRKAFQDHRPRAVVVEGLVSGDAKDAAERARQAESFAATAPDEFPENYYPIHLARRAGLPFDGGEPSLSSRLAAVAPRGYGAADVLALGVAAQVGYWNTPGVNRPRDVPRAIDGLVAADAAALGVRFSWADFVRWYESRGGLGKPPTAVTAEDAKPYDGERANFIQRLAAALEVAREESIVRRIEASLRAHKRVLVVYGSGHLVRQRKVWEKALGKSRDEKPY